MGVNVRKIRGSYYLVINHKGQRATRKVGGTIGFARKCAKQVQAKLTLNDLSIFSAPDNSDSPLFAELSERWLQKHIEVRKKPATHRLYSWLMEHHILPRFGKMRVNKVDADHVEDFIYALSKDKEDGKCVNANTTIKVTLAALRSFFSYAKKHKFVSTNPASCMGYAVQSDKEAREINSMTTAEVGRFLDSVAALFPDQFAMFLTAIRTGMRRGEFLGLKWGDCFFGVNEKDPNRYFTINRTLSPEGYGTPKTKGSRRRVDMSKHLRAVLMELRDKRLLKAMQLGIDYISDEPVFCDEEGKTLSPNNLAGRFMVPVCKAAGLRRFKPHDLRHTFAVLMLQDGVSLKYVSEQLGHSSIKITADVYGRLQPSVNIAQMDRLDYVTQTSANGTQTPTSEIIDESANVIDITAFRGRLLGGEDLIHCYKAITQTKEFTGFPWAINGQIGTIPQTGRKRKAASAGDL